MRLLDVELLLVEGVLVAVAGAWAVDTPRAEGVGVVHTDSLLAVSVVVVVVDVGLGAPEGAGSTH